VSPAPSPRGGDIRRWHSSTAAFLAATALLAGIGPPLAGESRSLDSSPLRLEELLAIAREANPDIRAAQLEVEAARARPSPARTVPNPRFDLTLRNAGADAVTLGDDPASGLSLGFVQELPYPGKLELRGQIEERGVARAESRQRLTELRVLSEVKATFFELSFVVESIAIVRKTREILIKLEKTAAARYEVGKGIQQDVLRAQVEISRLLETLTTLQQRRDSLKARLNQLINRPGDAPLGDPPRVETLRFHESYEELIESARHDSPALLERQHAIEQQQKVLALARRDLYPDFFLGGAYVDRGDFESLYQISVGLRIPLYRNRKERRRIEEATARVGSLVQSKQSVLQSVEARLRDLYLQAESSQQNADLYERGLLRQAELALESSISAYEVGSVDFLTLLDSLLRLLNDEIQYYRHVTNVAIAMARMEPDLNRELVTSLGGERTHE